MSLDCEKTPQLKFDPEICKISVGTANQPHACDFGKVKAEELSLQRWIKQVFKLVGITSEIPGVGEYPDLVTLEDPAFIEVKRKRITAKRKDSLKEQMIRYSQPTIITHTIKQLQRFSEKNWTKPDYLILTAPEGGQEELLIKDIRKETEDFEVTFLSLDNLEKICTDVFKMNRDDKKSFSLMELVQN